MGLYLGANPLVGTGLLFIFLLGDQQKQLVVYYVDNKLKSITRTNSSVSEYFDWTGDSFYSEGSFFEWEWENGCVDSKILTWNPWDGGGQIKKKLIRVSGHPDFEDHSQIMLKISQEL